MNSPQPIDVIQKLGQFQKQWTPHRIATFDDYQIVLAKVQGEFVWHDHKEHDEVFLPFKGILWVDFEDGSARRVAPGQVLVVPAGVRHRPRTEGSEEVHLMVIDPLNVQHTGDEDSDRTVHDYPSL